MFFKGNPDDQIFLVICSRGSEKMEFVVFAPSVVEIKTAMHQSFFEGGWELEFGMRLVPDRFHAFGDHH